MSDPSHSKRASKPLDSFLTSQCVHSEWFSTAYAQCMLV